MIQFEITDEQLKQVNEFTIGMQVKYGGEFHVIEYRFQPCGIAVRTLVVIGRMDYAKDKLIKKKFDISDYTKW